MSDETLNPSEIADTVEHMANVAARDTENESLKVARFITLDTTAMDKEWLSDKLYLTIKIFSVTLDKVISSTGELKDKVYLYRDEVLIIVARFAVNCYNWIKNIPIAHDKILELFEKVISVYNFSALSNTWELEARLREISEVGENLLSIFIRNDEKK